MRLLTLDSRLEAIAGPPAGMLVGAGTTGPLEGFTALGPMQAYFVWRTVDASTTSYRDMFRLGLAGNGIRWRERPGGSSPELSFGAGGQQTFIAFASVPGVHVLAASMNAGLTQGVAQMDDETPVVMPLPYDGTTIATPVNLFVGTDDAFWQNLLAAAYPAVHTDYQRNAIMRKLLQMSGA